MEFDLPPLPTRLLEGLTPTQIDSLIDGLQSEGRVGPYKIRYIFWILGALILTLAVALATGTVTTKINPYHLAAAPDVGTKVLQSLLGLLIIALFVERAQHVYIGVLRGFGRAQLDRAVARAREALEAVVLAEPKDPVLHLEVLKALYVRQDRLALYRLSTRKGAFLAGLFTGVVIALVGPRILQEFVDPHTLGELTRCAAQSGRDSLAAFGQCQGLAIARAAATQLWLFQTFDILVTGGLIGGGAEGLHSIVAAITGTADRIRKSEG